MRRTIPRCPKCGKEPVTYVELWRDSSIGFTAFGGIFDNDGYKDIGYPSTVKAICGCGHGWTLRGVSQITEIRDLYRMDNRLQNE